MVDKGIWYPWCIGFRTYPCGGVERVQIPSGTQYENISKIWSDKNLIKTLKDGGVIVMPTDTIYGMVGRAEDISVVKRIYKIRKRNPDKPCIILISDISF